MIGDLLNGKEDLTAVCTWQELKERYGARSNERGTACEAGKSSNARNDSKDRKGKQRNKKRTGKTSKRM